MKSKIVIVIAACMLYLAAFHQVKVNAAQVSTLRLNGTSDHGTTERSVTYKLSPGKSSLVKIKVFYASTSKMTATLTNLSTKIQKTIESSPQSGKSTIEFTYYAEAVKYELSLNFLNGDTKTNYSVVGRAIPFESGEGTNGNTLDYAAQLSLPDQIHGVISFGDVADCYKLSLNTEGNLKFNFVNLGVESLNVKIYDTYKNLLKVETIGGIPQAFQYEIPNANGNYYLMIDSIFNNGFGSKYELTVGDFVSLSALTFPEKNITLTAGASKTIKAKVTPSNATEKVLYKSSNKNIATVDKHGKIIAIKAGTATIKAYSRNGVVKTTLKLTVKAKTISRVSLNTTRKTMEVNATFQLKPLVYPSSITTTFTYTSSDPTVAKVDKKGKITAIKKGSCIITVITKNGKMATCKVTVTKKEPIVTPTPKPTQVSTPTPEPTIEVTSIKAKSNMIMLKAGENFKITYTIAPSNATDKTVFFSCFHESIATVDQNGVVTAVAAGTTIVNASTKDGKTMFVTVIVY